MADPSYTPDPALVELVAKAFITEAKKNPVDTSRYSWGGTSRMLFGPNEFDIARAVLAALATEPDLWQYGMPDLDEGPDVVMTFEGKPRIITPRMVRRPLRAVGPWLPAPTTDTDKITEEKA